MSLSLVVLALSVLIASSILTGYVARWAFRRGLVAVANERSSHNRPTAVGGGLAILVAVLLGLIAHAMLRPESMRTMVVYALGGAAVACVSWLDDVRSMSPLVRLAVHFSVSVLAVVGIGSWDLLQLPVLGSVHLGVAGYPITALWIVGLINAYNFMDGVDGIAGSTGVIAGIAWGWFGLASGASGVGAVGLFVAMACLGFLRKNWPPASIFMGDVGSAFLGYTFAVLPLLFDRATPGDEDLAPLVGILLVWPFIFDTTYTLLRRVSRQEHLFQAHRSHLYQRLVVGGWSHRTVSTVYVGLGSAGAVFGSLWFSNPHRWGMAITTGIILLGSSLVLCVGLVERKLESPA